MQHVGWLSCGWVLLGIAVTLLAALLPLLALFDAALSLLGRTTDVCSMAARLAAILVGPL